VDEEEVGASQLVGGEAGQDSTHPMFELLEEESRRFVPVRGEIMEGTVVSNTPSQVVVDIGCKSEGIVTARDLERLDEGYRESLNVGDKVFVYVIRPSDAQGNIILSLAHAQLESDWQRAAKLFESGEILEECAIGCNKGGLIVNVGRVRGFLPASLIVSIRLPRAADDEERQEQLGQLVGEKLRFKIIELDRRRNRLILSERAAMREWRQSRKERLLEELQEGEVRQGVVSSLCDFGAFVDLGGADGLVHLSELSWRRIRHPRQILEVGDKVDVYVLGVDRERRRIALSIKRLQADPWSTVEERFRVGQLVTGTVTKIADFGAFARLDADIEGLIHISELSDERIEHPSEVVEEEQELTLRVIRVEPARQRLGLSLRRVKEEQHFDDFDWQETGQVADLGQDADERHDAAAEDEFDLEDESAADAHADRDSEAGVEHDAGGDDYTGAEDLEEDGGGI
jgi:small subunit ribosomal protein S1